MASEYPSRRRKQILRAQQHATDAAPASQSSFTTNHSNQTFHFTAASTTTPSEGRPQTIFERLAQNSSATPKQSTASQFTIESGLQSLGLANSDTNTDSDSSSDSYSGDSSEDSEAMENSRAAKAASALAEEVRLEKYQLSLLNTGYLEQDTQQIRGTPIFAHGVLKSHPDAFSQYGFLAGDTTILDDRQTQDESSKKLDPRLYFNIAAPSSVFICGSQGSGKSHSLSCLLENCLVKSDVNKLDNPLAGLVFHYDTFTSDTKGIPCEAAHLASDKNIKVKILCSPANVETIKVSANLLRYTWFH